MATKTLILIPGMHRSGTSAVAWLCHTLGATLGPDLLEADANDNAKGYWEDTRIVELHNTMLSRVGLGPEMLGAMPPVRDDCISVEMDALRAHLHEHYAPSALSVVKDPRMCRFVPEWQMLAEDMRAQPVALIPLRHPLEVVASMQKRDAKVAGGRVSPFAQVQYGLFWWLSHVLETEYHTRNMPRSFFHYDMVIADWRGWLEKVTCETGIEWLEDAEQKADEIQAFLSPELRHHLVQHDALEQAEATGLVAEAYKALSQLTEKNAAQHTAVMKELDIVREAFAPMLEVMGAVAKADRDAALYEATNSDVQPLEALRASTAFEMQTLHHQIGALHDRLQAVETAHASSMRHISGTMESVTEQMQCQARTLEHYGKMMEAVWQYQRRLWLPLRALKRIVKPAVAFGRKAMIFTKPSMYRHGLTVLRREGPKGVTRRLKHYFANPHQTQEDYTRWYTQYGTLKDTDRDAIKKHILQFAKTPTVSIILPVYNTDKSFLVRAIDSVKKQLYPHWQLCIVDDASSEKHVRDVLADVAATDARIEVKRRVENGHISRATNDGLDMAIGEYIAFLDHDDVLAEHALYCMVKATQSQPEAKLFYSDEDKIDESGRHLSAHFKPDWNHTLFLSYNYLCHFVMVEAELAKQVRFKPEYNGCQDYAFLLGVIQHITPEQIVHISEILYHWRECEGSTAQSMAAKPYAIENSLAALKDYAEKTQLPIENIAAHPRLSGAYELTYAVPEQQPKVCCIIPTRNRHELVEKCIESIREKAGYENYEILLVDNQSDDPAALKSFAVLEQSGVRVVRFDEPFNYAKMNNWAVAQTDAELVAFINNDIHFTSEGWLREMVACMSLGNVGAVGAKLLFPDGKLQHAGVCLRGGYRHEAVAGHFFAHWPGDTLGYMGRAVLRQELSAVTAAAMLVDRAAFDGVGGFNDERLAVAFNDIDLCLKLNASGRKVIYSPLVEAIHEESASRGYEDTPEKLARFAKETEAMYDMWGDTLRRDRFYNPNLSPHSMDYRLAWPPEHTRPWEHLTKEDAAA